MKWRMSVLICGLALALVPAGAEACRVRPRPVIPIESDYDAIAMVSVVGNDDYTAEARVEEVLDGRVDGATVQIEFAFRPGGIISSCGPPGPPLRTGDRAVVVFHRDGVGRQYVLGWVLQADAERHDDFFLRYARAGTEADRRRLRLRWTEVNRHRGPVPRSDPSRWMAPHAGGLRGTGAEGRTVIWFLVRRDGRIGDCRVEQPMPAERDLRDLSVCDMIRRHRFKPPMFEREGSGYYEVRWPDAAQ